MNFMESENILKLKRFLRIPHHQEALTTRNNYKENWYTKTFLYEEGALK